LVNRTGALRRLWTDAWAWALLVAVLLIVRFWFDLFVPRSEWTLRVLKQALIAVCLLAGARPTWRTGQIRTGVLVAFAAGLIGALVGLAGYAAIVAIRHDPATQASLYEGGDLPPCGKGCHPLLPGRRPAGAWQGPVRPAERRSSGDAALSAHAFHRARRGRVENSRPEWDLSRILLHAFGARHSGVSRLYEKDPGDTYSRPRFGKEAVKGAAP